MIQETVRLPHSAIHSLDGRYHPFHPPIPPLRPKMCRKPYSFNSTFSVPSLGERSYFYMLQTWITAHDCTRVVTTMAIVEKCLAQFGQGRSSDLIKSQVEHGCSLHLPDINTANLDGWSSIVEEENIGIWFIGYGWVGSHVDCHAPTLYKSLNHRLIHLQNISQCLGFYIIKIHIFYTW